MARERKPGRQPRVRRPGDKVRSRLRGLRGHDKSRNNKFGWVGAENGGWSLGWAAAKGKVGINQMPKSGKFPAGPITTP